MLIDELDRFIGETVTIFTASGGVSGFGFTGVLLRVNSGYVTLVNRLGTPPTNPLSEVIYNDRRNGRNLDDNNLYVVGSICDIPVDKITAFSHRAI